MYDYLHPQAYVYFLAILLRRGYSQPAFVDPHTVIDEQSKSLLARRSVENCIRLPDENFTSVRDTKLFADRRISKHIVTPSTIDAKQSTLRWLLVRNSLRGQLLSARVEDHTKSVLNEQTRHYHRRPWWERCLIRDRHMAYRIMID